MQGGSWTGSQQGALRMTRDKARQFVRDDDDGAITVRLISRAEAVARERKRVLEEVRRRLCLSVNGIPLSEGAEWTAPTIAKVLDEIGDGR